MSILELRDRLMPKLPTTTVLDPGTSTISPSVEQPVLVVEGRDRITLTAPVTELLASETAAGLGKEMAERLYVKLRGRFVEAEKANQNGAYWSAADLEIGLPTVAYGPLNWLHDERKVVGTLTHAWLVSAEYDEREAAMDFAEREQARKFSTEERRNLAKSGKAMKDLSFPIVNIEDLHNAIKLAHTPAQRRHVIRRARALGAMKLIPDTWTREKAATEIGPHISSDAVMWRWLYPQETRIVERAADEKKLWYSMECISPVVECVGTHGCGAQVPYLDALRREGAACSHIKNREATRRFVDPIFQGGGIIVPPITPGWASADLSVVREAAAALESDVSLSRGLEDSEAAAMVQQVLEFARR